MTVQCPQPTHNNNFVQVVDGDVSLESESYKCGYLTTNQGSVCEKYYQTDRFTTGGVFLLGNATKN